MAEYHVSTIGDDGNIGDALHPLRTISRAAVLARPGDVVTVHEGTYRESVDPAYGGESDSCRIVYQGADGECKPVIKGSERVSNWIRDEAHPGVWKTMFAKEYFGGFNPFAEPIFGDWLDVPKPGVDPVKHLGDVYLCGEPLYEVTSLDELYAPQRRETIDDYDIGVECAIENPDMTQFVWFAQVDEISGDTTVWANFQHRNPNEELVEVSVRQTCFFPSRHHRNYITVRNFEMCQAATNWAPPTSHQMGMIGPNWALSWIIEDNVLHHAKFSAVCLGKEEDTGENEHSLTGRKQGYQYQLEAVFKARRIGWQKGYVGSHIVRNNEIHHCGQNGVVGHLGCIDSQVIGNDIHHIGVRREFYGYEIAGIKFHAAIDAVIAKNDVHDCSLGMWLDWQAQGVRISSNVFHDNVRDMMFEVTHGPLLVDSNVFASPITWDDFSQGSAFVNNLICGSFTLHQVLKRSTPYHYPHSTEVAGTTVVSGGDERFYGNIFAPQTQRVERGSFGLSQYESNPATLREYNDRLGSMWATMPEDEEEKYTWQPIYAANNVHASGLESASVERDGVLLPEPLSIRIEEREDGCHLLCEVPQSFAGLSNPVVTTDDLGQPRVVEERYEHPDGTPYVLDTDMEGVVAERVRVPGPLQALRPGICDICVFKRR